MRRSLVGKAALLCGLVLFGCGGDAEPEPQEVFLGVSTTDADGAPVEMVRFLINGKKFGMTDDRGQFRGRFTAVNGDEVVFSIDVPKGYKAPAGRQKGWRQTVEVKPEGQRTELNFSALLFGPPRTYGLVVKTNLANNPVEVNGKPVGETGADGVAFLSVVGHPGLSFTVRAGRLEMADMVFPKGGGLMVLTPNKKGFVGRLKSGGPVAPVAAVAPSKPAAPVAPIGSERAAQGSDLFADVRSNTGAQQNTRAVAARRPDSDADNRGAPAEVGFPPAAEEESEPIIIDDTPAAAPAVAAVEPVEPPAPALGNMGELLPDSEENTAVAVDLAPPVPVEPSPVDDLLIVDEPVPSPTAPPANAPSEGAVGAPDGLLNIGPADSPPPAPVEPTPEAIEPAAVEPTPEPEGSGLPGGLVDSQASPLLGSTIPNEPIREESPPVAPPKSFETMDKKEITDAIASIQGRSEGGGLLTKNDAAFLTKVKKGHPKYHEANRLLGGHYFRLKAYGKQASALEKATSGRRYKHDPRILLSLAKAYAHLKKYGAALSQMRKVETKMRRLPASAKADAYRFYAEMLEFEFFKQYHDDPKAANISLLDRAVTKWQRYKTLSGGKGKSRATERIDKLKSLKSELEL